MSAADDPGQDELAERPGPSRARPEPDVWERPERSDADDRVVVLDDADDVAPLAADDLITGDPGADDLAVNVDDE